MPQPEREQVNKPQIIEFTDNLQRYMHSHNKVGFAWEPPKLYHDDSVVIDDMQDLSDD